MLLTYLPVVLVAAQRYMELTEELEKRRRTDVQTIEGMVQDYNHLVQEAQTQEERQAKRIRVRAHEGARVRDYEQILEGLWWS